MAYDYTSDIAFANEIIAEYGRPISFVKASDGAVDDTNPLAGPVVATPVRVDNIMAAFVELKSSTSLGLNTREIALFGESTEVALVAPDVAGTNFKDFNFIIDTDGKQWKIEFTYVFKPGLVPVLYYVGVIAP